MSTPAIRRARAGDEAALSLLGGATFLAAFAHDHPGDVLLHHIAAKHAAGWYGAALADPANALWLAETPLRAPIGYAMLATPDLDAPTQANDLELVRLYVLPAWQGSGLGLRLLHVVEAEARTRGATRLLLCVYSANPGAQRFYARHGFADTGARQIFFPGTDVGDDQVWAKRLG